MENTNADINARIAELRTRFARLKATCGLRAISRETIESYAEELAKLQTQLN